MGKMVSGRELRQMYESLGPQETEAHLTEALDSGHLRAQDFSIRDLFVNLVEGGKDLLYEMSNRRSGGRSFRSLTEAADAVSTDTFSNITGQIVYNRVKEAYQDPAYIWSQLVDSQMTQFLTGERIPGIGRVGDKAEVVGEGRDYPRVGMNEEYIDTKPLVKRGDILGVTREMIIADRTGLLLRLAGELGLWMGLNLEKRVIDVVTGQTNNYKRNGTATNTFLTSGAYINSQTGNALNASGNEWRAIENADLLFDAITDPNTGEPISVVADTLLVPSALFMSAHRIYNATGVNHVDMQANAVTVRTDGGNPLRGPRLRGGSGAVNILTSPQVKLRTSSATQWFYGQPKRSFLRLFAWDIEAMQAPAGHPAEFDRDIMMQWKVSVMDHVQALEPRYMTKNAP